MTAQPGPAVQHLQPLVPEGLVVFGGRDRGDSAMGRGDCRVKSGTPRRSFDHRLGGHTPGEGANASQRAELHDQRTGAAASTGAGRAQTARTTADDDEVLVHATGPLRAPATFRNGEVAGALPGSQGMTTYRAVWNDRIIAESDQTIVTDAAGVVAVFSTSWRDSPTRSG